MGVGPRDCLSFLLELPPHPTMASLLFPVLPPWGTHTHCSPPLVPSTRALQYYTADGACPFGTRCFYLHEPGLGAVAPRRRSRRGGGGRGRGEAAGRGGGGGGGGRGGLTEYDPEWAADLSWDGNDEDGELPFELDVMLMELLNLVPGSGEMPLHFE